MLPLKSKAAQTQEEGGNLPLKYPVEIRTDNSEVKAMLQEYLPLITQQQQEVLDREQVGFLAEDAPDNVQTMLRTKGYFNGRVTVSPAGEGYVVAVAPGPQTKIENVGVAILGDILQDEDLSAYYKNALNNCVSCLWAMRLTKAIGAAAKPPCSRQ